MSCVVHLRRGVAPVGSSIAGRGPMMVPEPATVSSSEKTSWSGESGESRAVRLIACHVCRTQLDVTHVVDAEVTCRCGEKLANREFEGHEVDVHRCSACGAQVASDAESCQYCGSAICRDSQKLSLICPECYGRNEDDARFCVGCGVAFRPEQVSEQLPELPCPSCTCLMPVRAIGTVGVNECPGCNGLWVPEDKFDHLIVQVCQAARGNEARLLRMRGARRSGGNPSGRKVEYRKCPVCDAFMQRSNFQKRSGVIIDRCHSHGTWLDADELEAIAGFIIEGGMQESAREYQMRQEINAAARRNAEALLRARTGESITIERREDAGIGETLLGVLSSLLK